MIDITDVVNALEATGGDVTKAESIMIFLQNYQSLPTEAYEEFIRTFEEGPPNARVSE